MFNQKIKKMYANQYQIESGATEKYKGNHRYIANELGDYAETGESARILFDKLKCVQDSSGIDLNPILYPLSKLINLSVFFGEFEKNFFRKRNEDWFKNLLTKEQVDALDSISIEFTPEEVEHYESEKGDELFHIARGLASVDADLEHCMIKNRLKLDYRNRTNTIHEHKDH